jgi:hypothetical protein
VDEIGQPLENKPVEVVLSSGEVKSLKSNAQGKISVPSVPAFPASVAVNKPSPKAPQWPINLKGAVFYNRSWKYNTSTVKPAEVVHLSGAKSELFIRKKGTTTLTSHGKIALKDTGFFNFTAIPECDKVVLRLYLEHDGSKIVVFKGLRDIISSDMEIKIGLVPWHDVEIDMKKISGLVKDTNVGDIEIKKPIFTYLCDAYMTIRFGHERLKKLTGYDAPRVLVNYPEPTGNTSFLDGNTGELHFLELDLRDRDVLLHEYGHFIAQCLLPTKKNATYHYNDDQRGIHSIDSKEHYEPAWNEALGTFLSCVLSDDPVYRDGYDANLTVNLKTETYKIGHHNETSILQALWELYLADKKNFKSGMWEAWTNKTKRTVSTSIDFYDNWKALKMKGLALLVAAYKKHNMEYGYRYLDGVGKFTAVAPPKKFNVATKEFVLMADLYKEFSKPLNGSLKGYLEEFSNRNIEFNAGALDVSSTRANPVVKTGSSYIIPKLIKLS